MEAPEAGQAFRDRLALRRMLAYAMAVRRLTEQLCGGDGTAQQKAIHEALDRFAPYADAGRRNASVTVTDIAVRREDPPPGETDA